MNRRSLHLGALLCLSSSLLIGCGSGGVPALSQASAKGLAGNWLIVGTLPAFGVATPANTLNLTLTLDANGNQVSGAGFIDSSCGSGSFGGNFGLTPGALTSDGSFALQTLGGSGASGPVFSLELQGTAPTNLQTSWQGMYTASNISSCLASKSGQFTATRIQDLTGTYVGSTTLAAGTAAPVPVTVRAVFQQGGTSIFTKGFSEQLLNGTIEIDGLPCSSTGTTTTTMSPSLVQGDLVLLNFSMGNGAVLLTDGYIGDVGAEKLILNYLELSGGQCGGLSRTPALELDKQ